MGKKLTLFERISNAPPAISEEQEKKARYSMPLKVLIFALTVLICAFFFSFQYDIVIGDRPEINISSKNTWNGKMITAEYSFPVYKSKEQYLREVEKAKANSPDVFLLSRENEDKAYGYIERNFKILNEVSDTVTDINIKNIDFGNFGGLSETIPQDLLIDFFERSRVRRSRALRIMEKKLNEYLQGVYKHGFINKSLEELKTDHVFLDVSPNEKKIYPAEYLTDNISFREKFEESLKPDLDDLEYRISEKFLGGIAEANFLFSEEHTEKAASLAAKNVPRTEGVVKKGTKLISSGEPLNKDKINKLQSYLKSDLLRRSSIVDIWHFAGSIIHAFIIVLILFLYIFFIRKRIFHDNLMILILCSILIFTGLMAWFSLRIPTALPIEYFILIPGLSMLTAILFDSRTAFYTTVAMSFMAAGIRGSDYDAALVLLFAGCLAAYSVRDIQSRTQMYSSILFMFAGFVIAIGGLGLERSYDFVTVLNRVIVSTINAFVSPILTYGLLFMIERTTNITTDLKLQEYNNLNHPLLLKLNDIAPGTYQHTQSVALLAERCASAIGANPLLTKVGAYFHDIGKIAKAEYFAENQMNIENKHDKISPKKSAEAIKEHVIEGTKLAKGYNLPQRIIDFIPMHHGTTLIKHFYAKALEEAENTDDVNEEDFRYPGPKPNSRETAVLMICDSAEALSRISKISSDELEKAIDAIIKDRFLDGQFDESDISLSDLKKIKETCLKHLIGKGHSRVKYKEIPKKK